MARTVTSNTIRHDPLFQEPSSMKRAQAPRHTVLPGRGSLAWPHMRAISSQSLNFSRRKFRLIRPQEISGISPATLRRGAGRISLRRVTLQGNAAAIFKPLDCLDTV
jgi:hypothetical protein